MFFSPDYVTARSRFRAACERLSWSCFAYPIGATGPLGEDLTIEVAISPKPGSDRVIVVSSGLHGVEGFFGSAVQLALMHECERSGGLSCGARLVLLHALNPYGFAWSRRVDSENIDVNRNFLQDHAPFSGSPSGYAQLDSFLNPRRPPCWRDHLFLQGTWPLIRHGRTNLKQIIAQGQFDFPKGMFFGGHGPARTHQIIRQHMASWIGDSSSVVHLDFHTGLGKWATHKLLLDDPLDSEQRSRAACWFGADNIEQTHMRGISYQLHGSFGSWCARQRFAPEYLFAFAEFGTYGNAAMLAGLRAENQAHHWDLPGAESTLRVKSRLRELFCPKSIEWRSSVLQQSTNLVRRAASGLSSEVRRKRPYEFNKAA